MITQIFTKKNIQIIQLITEKELCIREIAEELKISPAKVHQTIKLLKKHKMIIENKKKNKLIITPNKENILLKKIKLLINTTNLLENKHFKKLQKQGKIGLYGSYAKGEDDSQSDIDLWIHTHKNTLELQQTIRELEKDLKRKINLLKLNSQKLKKLEKNDYEFYIRLKLTSTQFNGDIFDQP